MFFESFDFFFEFESVVVKVVGGMFKFSRCGFFFGGDFLGFLVSCVLFIFVFDLLRDFLFDL